jgi:hypothetical protein
LHRARDDYGRQARDEDGQHKEQIESGRAVVFFYMNHGFARSKPCEMGAVSRRARGARRVRLAHVASRA